MAAHWAKVCQRGAKVLQRAGISFHHKSNHVSVSGPLRCSISQRWNSTSANLVRVEADDNRGLATVYMNNPPVNMFSMDFLTQLTIELEKLENNKNIKGLVITSDINRVFCAGLDLSEVQEPERERLTQYWRIFQNLCFKLYGSRLATCAAVNGHAMAGGTAVATVCDHRVMADNSKYKMGLNETVLGIVPPVWLMDVTINTIGERQAELALQQGSIFTPQEALQIGWMDQLVPEDEVLSSAHKEMAKWLKIPEHARQLTKSAIRKPTIDRMFARSEESTQSFVNHIMKDSTQKIISDYLQNLRKR